MSANAIHRPLLLLSLLLLLSACTSTPQSVQLYNDPQVGNASYLLDLPFFPQTPYHCGPAALAGVLNFRGQTVSPEELAPEIYLPARRGSLPLEISAAVRARGLLAYPVGNTLQALISELAAGNPVLLLQNLGFSWWPQWHYAVLVGADLPRREFILHSGTIRNYHLPITTFERTWQRADYWGLVIVKAGSIPASATEISYLRSAAEWSRSNPLKDNRILYLAATRRWPDSMLSRLSLVNSLYHQGNFKAAIDQLLAAIEQAPASAQLWNNLAFIARDYACPALALTAAERALSLAGSDANIRDTWQRMQALEGQPDAAHCPQLNAEDDNADKAAQPAANSCDSPTGCNSAGS